MADDRHFKPGSFYRMDDRTGFKVRAEKTKKEWTGRIVRLESFEPRNAQDFVRGVRDDQSVPDGRPRQTDVFVAATGAASFLASGHRFFVQHAPTFGVPPAAGSACINVIHPGILASSL